MQKVRPAVYGNRHPRTAPPASWQHRRKVLILLIGLRNIRYREVKHLGGKPPLPIGCETSVFASAPRWLGNETNARRHERIENFRARDAPEFHFIDDDLRLKCFQRGGGNIPRAMTHVKMILDVTLEPAKRKIDYRPQRKRA